MGTGFTMTTSLPPLNAFPGSLRDRAKAAFYQMPLSTRAESEMCLGLSENGLKMHWADLNKTGELTTYGLGATLRNSKRAHLSEIAALKVGSGYVGWNGEAALAGLLERLPLVEHSYRVAAGYAGKPGLHSFQWILGDAIQAAARISHTEWIAICWSGPQETEHDLLMRMRKLDADLRRLGVSALDPSIPWHAAYPSLFAFVVSDAWQGELVRRASHRAGIEHRVDVYCAAEQLWVGGRQPLGPGAGWLHALPPVRDMGGWPFEKRAQDSPFALSNGRSVYQVSDLLHQFGGVGITNLAKLGGGMNQKQVDAALDVLFDHRRARDVDLKLSRLVRSKNRDVKDSKSSTRTVRLGNGAQDIRYGLTSRALESIRLRDGYNITHSQGISRVISWDEQMYDRQRGHEDKALEVLAGFGAAKLPVAAGWRADDKFPVGGIEPGDEFRIGGINPDGIIFLTESPYGPGCHYLEVERRAQHEGTLKNKFKSYLSDNRSSYSPGPGDPPPLLFFCPSERIEALVHQIAAGFPVLTITEKRWRQNTPFDGWSQFGTRVRLG